jgi:hypothetical protein
LIINDCSSNSEDRLNLFSTKYTKIGISSLGKNTFFGFADDFETLDLYQNPNDYVARVAGYPWLQEDISVKFME